MTRILIVGHKGQLGRILYSFPSEHERLGIDLPEHDITNASETQYALREMRPQIVINTAALANVDAAESNPELAYRINAHAAGTLARACCQLGASFYHISTNEVFAGDRDEPYDEWDTPDNVHGSVYARSKRAGERAARFYSEDVRIVRIAWLFAPGGVNFPAKIVAAADKRGALQVVDDEFGNPTYAPHLVLGIYGLIGRSVPFGIYHLTNQGKAKNHLFLQTSLRLSEPSPYDVYFSMHDHTHVDSEPPIPSQPSRPSRPFLPRHGRPLTRF